MALKYHTGTDFTASNPWLGGQSQVKAEVWIMACALAAQSCCVAPRKPLHLSTQTSTFPNTLIAHLLLTPSPFESIPLWPFWGYWATWFSLGRGEATSLLPPSKKLTNMKVDESSILTTFALDFVNLGFWVSLFIKHIFMHVWLQTCVLGSGTGSAAEDQVVRWGLKE